MVIRSDGGAVCANIVLQKSRSIAVIFIGFINTNILKDKQGIFIVSIIKQFGKK